ncbi:SH3 domain-containing protein 2 [Castilleja foliolosa]|uniref:SH3 domain-containing protein 2 n=1 Tax=Castilleja foliolosa TaxID=1961234 RepID=A0ABD3CX44_9LAMI
MAKLENFSWRSENHVTTQTGGRLNTYSLRFIKIVHFAINSKVDNLYEMEAVLTHFASGIGGSYNIATDESELLRHDKLEKLYISTRAAKHFQRDIVRGLDGYIVTGNKQVQIANKLSEDSRKYGVENTCSSGNMLSRVALTCSKAFAQIAKERENLLKLLGTQVTEPLRAMVVGSPLENARHLAQKYDRVRQEAESQVIEVARCQARVREPNVNPDNISKLEAAETKLHELKSNMASLGKEATATMAAVEGQQQRLTLQRLIVMVEAERTYHRRVLEILNQLESEMLSERQHTEASRVSAANNVTPPPPAYNVSENFSSDHTYDDLTDGMGYFLGEVIHPYQAESEVELTLALGDYVVVRKVTSNGWAEGECQGQAGWFPFQFVERRERVPASKVAEVF